MTKTTVALIVAIIVIGGAFLIVGSKQRRASSVNATIPANATSATSQATASDTATAANNQSVASGKKVPFGQFVKQGGSYRCTVNEFTDPSYTSTTKGTIYLSNGLVRGDFTVNYDGGTIKTTFVKRDGFVYTWEPGISPGYKIPALEQAPASGQSGWTPDMVGDYDCKTWAANASLFVIPTNLSFETAK